MPDYPVSHAAHRPPLESPSTVSCHHNQGSRHLIHHINNYSSGITGAELQNNHLNASIAQLFGFRFQIGCCLLLQAGRYVWILRPHLVEDLETVPNFQQGNRNIQRLRQRAS